MFWFIGPKLVYVVGFCSILLIIVDGWEECDDIHYTNSWAVHIENGEPQVADRIAKRHGFINLGQVCFSKTREFSNRTTLSASPKSCKKYRMYEILL